MDSFRDENKFQSAMGICLHAAPCLQTTEKRRPTHRSDASDAFIISTAPFYSSYIASISEA